MFLQLLPTVPHGFSLSLPLGATESSEPVMVTRSSTLPEVEAQQSQAN